VPTPAQSDEHLGGDVVSAPSEVTRSLGRRLVAVHDELRETLHQLRTSSQPGRDGSLAVHCLAFCSAVDQHHHGENVQLFPQVVTEDPRLAAAVRQLQHDHGLIGFLLRDLAGAVRALPSDPDPEQLERFRRTLDGLSAVLESHFRLEERTILDLIDEFPDPAAPPSWDVRGDRQDDGYG
jgi:hypothetical protein